jgi:hypothetical protein
VVRAHSDGIREGGSASCRDTFLDLTEALIR